MDEAIKKIILCYDNSDPSVIATEISISIARAFGSEVVGIHGYNASMHEGAFRIMEPTLPEKYQKEEILERQRDVHNKLINIGMEKISLSYLRPLRERFAVTSVDFRENVREGKNFRAIKEIIEEEQGDLVIMGSHGFNSNGNGFIGSVCLRVLRLVDTNFLIVKERISFDNPRYVVCLDGSSSAIASLRAARFFAERFNAELHLIYVFDSALHKDLFGRLKESVINREGFSFNSKEQEKIHDAFIDKGLARVGSLILEKAEREVFSEQGSRAVEQQIKTQGFGLVGDGYPIVKKVLEGHIYKRICDYASEVEADLIFLGRTGRHYVEGIDIGSVTENVLRFAPCSVFIARSERFQGWQL
ncbi:MAG: universal stress protein [Thermodesulfovibrionales bacterium]